MFSETPLQKRVPWAQLQGRGEEDGDESEGQIKEGLEHLLRRLHFMIDEFQIIEIF